MRAALASSGQVVWTIRMPLMITSSHRVAVQQKGPHEAGL
jgi:hypothetical protein